MRRITHKYYISLQLLEDIERYINDKNPSLDDLRLYFRRIKLHYRYGLSKLED